MFALWLELVDDAFAASDYIGDVWKTVVSNHVSNACMQAKTLHLETKTNQIWIILNYLFRLNLRIWLLDTDKEHDN